jgi:hypothetical protein
VCLSLALAAGQINKIKFACPAETSETENAKPREACRMWFSPSSLVSLHSTVIMKMAWDRDECSLRSVTPTDRLLLPRFITFFDASLHRHTHTRRNLYFLDALDDEG